MNTRNDRFTKAGTLTFEQRAKQLDVPLLVILRIMFDGKVLPLNTDRVREQEVASPLKPEPAYLQTLG